MSKQLVQHPGGNQGAGDCVRVRRYNMHDFIGHYAARPRGHGQEGAAEKSKQAVELVVVPLDNRTDNVLLDHTDHRKLHLAHIAGEQGLGLGRIAGIF